MGFFILFCLLQLADIYTTHRILSKGGVELNPFMNAMFKLFGHLPALIVIKLVVCVLLYVFVIPQWVLIALCLLYVAVVIHNVRQLKGN